jgi:RNA polymerase sigma-70 factor (ECF subfamily)
MNDAADDVTLISRAMGGNDAAFGSLVERHFGAAYASAYAVLGNASDAEEIAQETFVQAFQKLERLREKGAFVGWIWRIARDLALKHIRKHGRMKVVEQVPEAGRENSPLAPTIADEEQAALRNALDQLPEEMRDAVLMKYWQELEYDEMARRTGVSEEALYQRVCRGLKRLRELLGQKEP